MTALSSRLQRTRFPPNAHARNRAVQLRAQGFGIIDLALGEPDFDTPAFVQEAAIAAIRGGDTRYPQARGSAALRAAIRAKLARENGLELPERRIAIANGAKQILYNAFAATLESERDEVLIPAPFWPSFPDLVTINGGTPRIVAGSAAAGFKLAPAQLDAALAPHTRWLVLNSPANPSGAVYSRAELLAFAEVLRRHPQLLVACDEVYEHIRFDDDAQPCNLATLAPDLQDRLLLIFSCSKTYAMPGWRLGFAAGPETLIDAMTIVQAQSTSGTSSISQAAAVAALNHGGGFVREKRIWYRQRRDQVVAALADLPGLSLLPPQGGFFAFVDCAALRGCRGADGRRIESDEDVAEYLLNTAHVAVVAGSAFGLPWHFRLSFAVDETVLARALRQLVTALREALAS